MKITTAQIAAAYAVAKAVFNDELPAELGARRLRDDHGFNINTARDYVENYRHMRDGEEFHRTISVAAADHFLSNIAEEDRAALPTAAASGEQSRGIEQVNQAITQMDEVTQQNAALVEAAAAASQSLEEQGRQLTESVAFFRLGAASP
jgi:hypothetical protein